MSEDKDIREVRRTERSRGVAKPSDKAERLLWDLKKIILAGDPRELVKFLHEAGIKEHSPEFEKALKVFYEVTGLH